MLEKVVLRLNWDTSWRLCKGKSERISNKIGNNWIPSHSVFRLQGKQRSVFYPASQFLPGWYCVFSFEVLSTNTTPNQFLNLIELPRTNQTLLKEALKATITRTLLQTFRKRNREFSAFFAVGWTLQLRPIHEKPAKTIQTRTHGFSNVATWLDGAFQN